MKLDLTAGETSALKGAAKLLAVAAVAAGVVFAVLHFHLPKPPDIVPKAAISGVYWPGAPTPARANPDAPATPIGMLRLDATGSKSNAPMIWQVRGPSAGKPRIFSPDGALAGSVAEADLFGPGTYHAHGTAVGLVGGRVVVDTGSVTVRLDGPGPPKPDVPPDPDPDVPMPPADRFVALGQSYRGTLSSSYADAFDAGAKLLDSGQPFSAALKQVAIEWGAARTANYDRVLTPEFGKIFAEGSPDAGMTAGQRSDMAKAWHGFAAGLRSK